jgi:membrane glycosyltransferase
VPALVNAESLFGRIQQFANRLYAPIFIAGLNYWALDLGNYWGHNAIIRTEPFMQFCDLPQLPGRKPFGGQILSHDFVEAALLSRENWEVWFAYDLEGSYEEAPQAMIENAQRDRRWCQGNMQHGLVLFAKGLARREPAAPDPGHLRLSRRPAVAGVFAHVQLDLLVSKIHRPFGHHRAAFTPYLNLSGTAHAFLIFTSAWLSSCCQNFSRSLTFSNDWPRRRAFGGLARANDGCRRNRFFHAARAIADALAHALCHHQLDSASASAGLRKNAPLTARLAVAFDGIGGTRSSALVWGALMWQLDPTLFWWFTPVLAGMVLSIPLSVLTSRRSLGARARKSRLFPHAGRNRAAGINRFAARMKVHELTGDNSPRGRTPGWPRRFSIPTSTPSTSRCCAKNSLIPFTPSSSQSLARKRPARARSAKNCWPAVPDKLTAVRTAACHGRPARDGLAAPAGVAAPKRNARAVVACGDSGIQPPD